MKAMPTGSLDNLQHELQNGLAIVTPLWSYKTKSWITSVCAADIDQDGKAETVVCTREGRVFLVSETGDERWRRIIGTKAWVGAAAVSDYSAAGASNARIVVGAWDGKIYVLDKNGRTIAKDGRVFPFGPDGKALDKEEQLAYWYDTKHIIRQIYVNPDRPMQILIGSDDRCAHCLDYRTGDELWTFRTSGGVRALFAYDINGDGEDEFLIGSIDGYLYLLDQQGILLSQYPMKHPIYAITAADVDQDGQVEVLVATSGNELVALNYMQDQESSADCFVRKWQRGFGNRFLSLWTVDIDADKNIEIIAGSVDKHIYILDAQGKLLWRHNYEHPISGIYPYDLNKDGLPELVIGAEQEAISAVNVNLRRGVKDRIKKYYRQIKKDDNQHLLKNLKVNERALLRDMFPQPEEESAKIEQARRQMRAGEHSQALLTLLKLEKQKVEQLWHREIPHIRTICLRRTQASGEIIAVTYQGCVQAFYIGGRMAWEDDLADQIVDVQTGFIDQNKQEEIIICSSSNRVYIFGKKRRTVSISNNAIGMSSICVLSPDRNSSPEIIIGSENKKLYIYNNDLLVPRYTISTKEDVRLVRASVAAGEGELAIATANLRSRIDTYTRDGRHLWYYETKDRVQAIRLKNINGDGGVELLIGSKDRNIHLIDDSGHLIWRHYLPHSVQTVDAVDVNGDGRVEIFAGCADGCLYVFDKEGDLQWVYQARDRINSVRVEDIDGDGNFEIALGTEDGAEFLRIVNQQQVSTLITQCWEVLCSQRPARERIQEILNDPDAHPLLVAFALKKFEEQNGHTSTDFNTLEMLSTCEAVEVRKALVRTVMTLYSFDSSRARSLLYQFWTDTESQVRGAIIEQLSLLLERDWELGFNYLKRATEHTDRFLRFLAVRRIYRLVNTSLCRSHEIFGLLLAAAQDENSEWIRQSTGRTLAHFLDYYSGNLIIYIHLFIVKGIEIKILQQIAHTAVSHTVRNYISAIIPLLSGLNKDNVLERFQLLVSTHEVTTNMIYGEDLCHVHSELARLFTLTSVEEIANYQCQLNTGMFHHKNKYARYILELFEHTCTLISRPLKIYLWRENVHDRLASLLECQDAIIQMNRYVDHQYSHILLGEPMTKLPAHQVFLLLLEKWAGMVQEELNNLRGNAEIKAELRTKSVSSEEQVVIWLTIENTGRSSASNLKITLLYSEHYDVVGKNSWEIESLAPSEGITPEFTLKPHDKLLNLCFEITYDNVDKSTKREIFEDCLELRERSQDFHLIPNPYSSGIPTHDSKMFYGRDKDMAFLRDHLTRDVKSVVVLYGQRRSGKTSVLIQLSKSPLLEKHIPVMIDMQRFSYHITIENFLRRVALAIAQVMRRRDMQVCMPDLNDWKEDPTYTFDAFLNQIEEQLIEEKLILLVDEFEVLEEQVTRGNLKSEIFEYLRNIVQHRQNISFLFAGTHKITEYTKWYRSVFFNMALHYRLSKLHPRGAEALITKPVEGFLEYEPLTVQKIRQLTADQPYLIHLFCWAIVDYCNEQCKTYVTINDVNTVLREVMQTSQFHFDWLWDQIKPEERVTLAALAESGWEEGRWVPFAEIEEIYRRYHIPYKHEYIVETLKTLLDADIIEDEQTNSRKSSFDGRRFKIPVGLIRRWLLTEHPLDLVRKEMNG
jgi:outer membrane protein assembly factor BamB